MKQASRSKDRSSIIPIERPQQPWLPRSTTPTFATKSDGSGREVPACHDEVGLQTDQFLRERSYSIDVTDGRTEVHPQVAAIGPTQFRNRLSERRDASLHHGIVFVARPEHADAPHPVGLLR